MECTDEGTGAALLLFFYFFFHRLEAGAMASPFLPGRGRLRRRELAVVLNAPRTQRVKAARGDFLASSL